MNTNKKCIKTRNITQTESNNIEIINFKCNFCNKDFSQKNNLTRHLESCKQKEIKEILDTVKPVTMNVNDISKELAILKEENMSLKENQIKLEYEINFKNEHIKMKEEKYISELKSKEEKYLSELKSKDEQLKNALKSLEKKEQEYTELLNSFKSIKTSGKSTTNNTTNSNNTTVNNYNVQFDKMVEKLLIFSPENIKKSINNINGYDLVYLNDFDGEKNFSSEFVKCVKNLTFCTDTSRGSLIVKKEDGNPDKITSESFVLKCLEDGKQECLQKIDTGIQFLRKEYKAGELDPLNSTMSVEDFTKCNYKLMTVREHIRQNGPNEVITSLSNVVAKTVDQLSSKNVRKQSKKCSQQLPQIQQSYQVPQIEAK